MTLASIGQLHTYLADLVEELERYAGIVLPPDDGDEITLGQDPGGDLVIDIAGRVSTSPGSRDVSLDVVERWRPIGRDEWACVEYAYELRHHELGYRRAFHRHDEAHFVPAYRVATHEHCEATLGLEACRHFYGRPVTDAFDGFRRLYETWLTDQKPDCLALTCLD